MRFRNMLCWTLCLGIFVMGCRAPIYHRLHQRPGEAASVKVWPYWVGPDGEKHSVAGLEVQLFRPGAFEPLASETTRVDAHTFFTDLEPGSYVVVVFAQGEELLRYDVEARAGQMLTMRADVEAVEAAKHEAGTPGSFSGSVIGDIFVVVGGVILILTVVGLVIALEVLVDDDDDHDDCHHRGPCSCH